MGFRLIPACAGRGDGRAACWERRHANVLRAWLARLKYRPSRFSSSSVMFVAIGFAYRWHELVCHRAAGTGATGWISGAVRADTRRLEGTHPFNG